MPYYNMFPDRINYDTNRKRVREAAMDICAYVRTKDKKLLCQVRRVHVSIDETTDIACAGNLQIVVSYVDPKTERLTTSCLGLVDCSGKQSAQELFRLVTDRLCAYSLPWSKVLSICTDDASNLTGRLHGTVQTGLSVGICTESN
jgi:hypothetical protein